METFDVVVIGAGPGGYPATIRAALLAGADTCARIKHAEAFGITVQGASVDYAVMIGHKNKVVSQLQGGIKQLLTANDVKQFAGVASFKDRTTTPTCTNEL